ncbi:MAG: tetratricopeptide repeat protein [Myxococcota bacterium]
MSETSRTAVPEGHRNPRGSRLFALICALIPLLGAIACGTDPAEQARELIKAGELDPALEILREAVEKNPDDPQINLMYGRALITNQQPSLAAWPLRRAASHPDYAVPANMALAHSLVNTNNNHDAVRAAERILAIEPDNKEAVRLRLRARQQNRDNPEAIEDLDLLIAAFPDELNLREQKFSALVDLERFDDAASELKALRTAVEARDDIGDHAFALLCTREAGLERSRGEEEAAEAKIEACLADHPESQAVFLTAVEFFDAVRKPERALEILRTKAEERPNDMELFRAISVRLADMGERDEARKMLEDAADRLQTPKSWLLLRNFLIDEDDLPGAKRASDQLLGAFARHPVDSANFDYARIPEQHLFESAIVMAINGDYERAREMQSKLTEKSLDGLLEARLLYEQGQLAEALDVWEEAFRAFPSNAGARYLAGIAALRLGEDGRAIEHLRNSLRADSSATDAGFVLARVHTARGEPKLALDPLNYHMLGHPDDIQALRVQARLAARVGNNEVLGAARSGLAVNHNRVGEAVADQARDLDALNGPERALEFLEKDVTIELDDVANIEALAAWFERMARLGRAEEGLPRVEKVVEAHPDVADVQALHGVALVLLERPADGRGALERALAIDAEHKQALMARAQLDREDGKLEAASTGYEAAFDADPRDPTPIYALAEMWIGAGNHDRATTRLRELLIDQPWEGRAAQQLAALRLEGGDHGDETLRDAQQASIFFADPGPDAFETLGRVQLAREETQAAVQSLRRAASLSGGRPGGLYRIGSALADAGDQDAAIRSFETALAMGEFPEAEQTRAALDALRPAPEG